MAHPNKVITYSVRALRLRLAAHSTIEHLATAAAPCATIKQAQAYTEREPEDRRKDA